VSPAAPSDFVNGVSTTEATIAHAFGDDRITVISGGVGGLSGPFEVIGPARIDLRFRQPARVGVPFTVQAIALDPAGRWMRSYQGTATWSDRSGSLTPATPARFVNGISTSQATITSPAHDDKLTLTSGGVSVTSGPFHVRGPLAFIGVSVPTTTAAQRAGRTNPVYPTTTSFTVTATAYDAAHTKLTDYNASATWSAQSDLTPTSPSPFVNGVSTTTATITSPIREDRITLTSAGISGKTTGFTITGPPAQITVRLTTPVTHGTPFTIRAIVKDSLGSTITTYNQPAAWTAKSGGLTPTTPTPFTNGTSTSQATLTNPYRHNQITITTGTLTGHTNTFNVR
jgi:hypothetical protein